MRQFNTNFTLISLLTILIILISGILFLLLLPACDIRILSRYLTSYCSESLAQNSPNNQSIDEISQLNRKIANLETALLNESCIFSKKSRSSEDVSLPDANKSVDQTEKSLTENEITAWESNDISFLNDCWTLEGSELTFRNVDTGTISKSDAMKVCFDANGSGSVQMSLEGSQCRGNVDASFDEHGALVLTDNADIKCTDGSVIFKSITTCNIDDQSVARCKSYQPSSGGVSEFILVRE